MDSEGVKKYFKDLLECPVCFQIIDSVPIHQCQNGHVVCKDCHPKMETCPICRDDKPIRNLKLEEIVEGLQLSNSETAKKEPSESIYNDLAFHMGAPTAPFPQQQPDYYAQANLPQQNVRFFGPGQIPARAGQPRWSQQSGHPQGQMMMPNSQFQRSRGSNPHMNFANTYWPDAAPMRTDRLDMPPQGMPPQVMLQVQPISSAEMASNLPRTPNLRRDVTQETRQVAVRSNDNIVEGDGNASCDCDCFCGSLAIGGIIVLFIWLFFW